MAKGPIIKHLQGQGTCNLVHYPLQDTLTAINDTQRQNYNEALICKGVSDDGDEELLRSDNYKRLFPWCRALKTTQSISSHLFRTRRKLNKLLRLNNTLMGVIQPTAASKLPPNLTPAQHQQVQAQKQAYDAQVAASRIAASQVAASQVAVSQTASPSTQKADVPASSQPELIHNPSAKNRSAIRLQSRGHFSPWVEPPLAYDNLSTPGATTNLSEQPGSATDSRSRQAHYQVRTKGNGRTGSYSKLLPLQNESSYEYPADRDSDSHTESSADITDSSQLSPTLSTSQIILKTEEPSPTKWKTSKSSRR
ncbi:uncharacterized protein Bfra_001151 [Botrytis fragariae]|uniref:Uncharacterized protein n=1 Tax=Botrytis fragariae TaxID=1964551 RepID=A0A8H6B3W6_9HELO|nr:uncharacterized protein Bfra_001151 [Botrytis fragariae]KAF5878978.1 hypothetical protein Bfra_001151 [Botrytis fragariae]